MRLIARLLGSVALLCIAISSVEAATRDQAGSLDWETFQFQNMELTWNIQPASSLR
jgi:hypothetical protein